MREAELMEDHTGYKIAVIGAGTLGIRIAGERTWEKIARYGGVGHIMVLWSLAISIPQCVPACRRAGPPRLYCAPL